MPPEGVRLRELRVRRYGHDKTRPLIGAVGKFWHYLLPVMGGERCVTSQITASKETKAYFDLITEHFQKQSCAGNVVRFIWH